MPGFAVGGEAVIAGGLVREEQEIVFRADDGERNDVPGIVRDDMGGEEIHFSRLVRKRSAFHAALGVEVVAASGEELGGGFHLHFGEAAEVFDDEIVAATVAVGFSDVEAETGGFVGERELAELAATFAIHRRSGVSG